MFNEIREGLSMDVTEESAYVLPHVCHMTRSKGTMLELYEDI